MAKKTTANGAEKGAKPNAKTPEIKGDQNQPPADTSKEDGGTTAPDKNEKDLRGVLNSGEPAKGFKNPTFNLVLGVTHNLNVVVLHATEPLSRSPKIQLPKEIQEHLAPGTLLYANAKITTKSVMEVPTTEITEIQLVAKGSVIG